MNKKDVATNNNILIELVEEGDVLARELDILYTKLAAMEEKAAQHGLEVKVEARNNQHLVTVLRLDENQKS